VGVLFEFDGKGLGQLSFYRNSKLVGKAFDSIPADTYYPCVSLLNNEDTNVQVTLNT
jgi:hypothetical protein